MKSRFTRSSFLPSGDGWTEQLLQQQMEVDTSVQFDPAAFQAAILAAMKAEINSAVNGATAGLRKDLIKELKVTPPPTPEVKAEPIVEPKPGEKIDPQINALQLQLKQMTEANNARIAELENKSKESDGRAEKKDRENFIVNKLANLKFRSEAARADAIEYFAKSAERDDSGNLISNNLPLDKYIEQEMGATGSRAYMIQPVETAGSGAGKGSAYGAGKALDLDNIKPGMGSDAIKAAADQIKAFMPR
jgi:hypothetical protein